MHKRGSLHFFFFGEKDHISIKEDSNMTNIVVPGLVEQTPFRPQDYYKSRLYELRHELSSFLLS